VSAAASRARSAGYGATMRVLAAAVESPVPTLRALRRKGEHVVRCVPRAAARARATSVDYERRPPVMVNSFPKSGTHLLWGIASALPRTRDYGAFVASVPSIVHRARDESATGRRLSAVAPGEIVRAHMWFDESVSKLVDEKNALHLFIYRDLRDVVVSEANYLSDMAPWHALHGAYAKAGDLSARVMLSIRGIDLPEEGLSEPDVGRRFEPYAAWLRMPGVVAVRFEDLVGDGLGDVLDRIGTAYAERATLAFDHARFVRDAQRLMGSGRSHTFRRGERGGWRDVFTDEHRAAMKAVAGDLLVELGYEADREW
jgi:hypothetical protein